MPVNGKLVVGDVLPDWESWPLVTIVVSVESGRLPTPMDLSAPSRGSSAERCAIYGGPVQWTRHKKDVTL